MSISEGAYDGQGEPVEMKIELEKGPPTEAARHFCPRCSLIRLRSVSNR
jgi:hypothetical protein